MKRTEIAAVFADSETLGGQEITVCGWVRTLRDMKTFGFYPAERRQLLQNLQVVLRGRQNQ